MQKRIYWNDGWKFKETYENQMRETAYQDDAWEDVRLPHILQGDTVSLFDEERYRWCAAIENIFCTGRMERSDRDRDV